MGRLRGIEERWDNRRNGPRSFLRPNAPTQQLPKPDDRKYKQPAHSRFRRSEYAVRRGSKFRLCLRAWREWYIFADAKRGLVGKHLYLHSGGYLWCFVRCLQLPGKSPPRALLLQEHQRDIVDDFYIQSSVGVGGGGENQPPGVDAGPDQAVTLPAAASLDGTVTDD